MSQMLEVFQTGKERRWREIDRKKEEKGRVMFAEDYTEPVHLHSTTKV